MANGEQQQNIHHRRQPHQASLDRERNLKWLSVVLMTAQQTLMPLLVRLSRDQSSTGGALFITTVNVFCMDVIKLLTCAIVISYQRRSFFRFLGNCHAALFGDPLETLKVCVPALIYNFQNNLYYIALTHLESTTYCVLYQMRIPLTALFLRLALGKRLSVVQWLALGLLVAGVAIVQLHYEPPKLAGSAVSTVEQSPLIGFVAVFAMCLTSAFAGVYLERVMKHSEVSVFLQNVRLALFGLLTSTVLITANDLGTIHERGAFIGFNGLVWVMTFSNALGGLMIAVVIRYADNIVKTYGQSLAIVGAGVGSWLLFDFVPSGAFFAGTALVLVSIFLYNNNPNGNGNASLSTLISKKRERPSALLAQMDSIDEAEEVVEGDHSERRRLGGEEEEEDDELFTRNQVIRQQPTTKSGAKMRERA